MRAIRIFLLLIAIAALLPSPPYSRQARMKAPAPGTYVGQALDGVVDLDPFCAERESVCTTAGYLVGKLEAKALYNIGLLYSWAKSEHAGQVSPLANQAAADPMTTGSSSKLFRQSKSSHNTLRLDDLIPAWRGPEAS
jgi:hypothetical protein